MAALLREHAHEVAAVIVEPLVQGAAGILTHPDGYLRAVRELCDAHDVLLICDEVATGFGRTGTMFACEQEGVSPDLMCVAKGLTGGYLPLAATLATERIYEAFLGEYAELKTFFHGHTYTGNPLACAAALATLDVFEREDTLARLQPKIALLRELLDEHVAPLPSVREVRQRGFMVGIELTDFPLAARMGHQVTRAARRRGAFVRPLGDVVVLMAALSITAEELERLVTITAGAIDEATTSDLQTRGVGPPRRGSPGAARRGPPGGAARPAARPARRRGPPGGAARPAARPARRRGARGAAGAAPHHWYGRYLPSIVILIRAPSGCSTRSMPRLKLIALMIPSPNSSWMSALIVGP